jgi:hypothetical protein
MTVLLASFAVGIRFHAAASDWQVAALVFSVAALGAILAWRIDLPRRASVGIYAGSVSRHKRSVGTLLPVVAAAIALVLLWLGSSWPVPDVPGELTAIMREEPGFIPPPAAGSAAALRVTRAATSPEPIIAEPSDWTRIPSLENAASQRVYQPVATDRARLSWIQVGLSRWPARHLPSRWPIAPDAAGTRLASRTAPHFQPPIGDPVWDVEPLLLASTPDAYPPAQASDQLERFGMIGLKPTAAEVAAMTVPSRAFQWSIYPAWPGDRLISGSAAGLRFPLFLGSPALISDEAEHPSFTPQTDVLSADYSEPIMQWRLTQASANPDLLGESGLAGGTRVLDGLARVWKSRAYAAPAGFFVPASAPQRTMASPWRLAIERYPPPALGPFASNRIDAVQAFARNDALGVVVLIALAAVARSWARTGDSGRAD